MTEYEYENCPVYESEDDISCGEYIFEGSLCNRRCRYLRETIDELLEEGRTRLALVEGYEFPHRPKRMELED